MVVYVLALGTFLMLTTEFVVAGILPEVADDLGVALPRAAQLITVFALGMIVGAPAMTILTMRLSKRLTLTLALLVFVAGHGVVAVSTDFLVLLVARFITAVATGAFWAVAAVVATRAAAPSTGARALGVVSAGGALATVLGVPIGALIAQGAGWRGTFWVLAAAAAAAAALVWSLVPVEKVEKSPVSVGGQLGSLASVQLWLSLLACLTTAGGVMAAYSYISPILTDRAGLSVSYVPLALTGFGVGSVVGTILAGRFGDDHPGLITVATPAITVGLLVSIAVAADSPVLMTVLVVLLGLFGLSANGVLIHLVVRHARQAGALGSALAVSAFNLGTALGTEAAGATLSSPLGLAGPAVLGAVVVGLTLIPTSALAMLRQRTPSSAVSYASSTLEISP